MSKDFSRMRLRKFYKNVFRPRFHFDARQRTPDEYFITINRWELLTSNRRLEKLTEADLYEFRNELSTFDKPATVNKHLRHINTLLNKA